MQSYWPTDVSMVISSGSPQYEQSMGADSEGCILRRSLPRLVDAEEKHWGAVADRTRTYFETATVVESTRSSISRPPAHPARPAPAPPRPPSRASSSRLKAGWELGVVRVSGAGASARLRLASVGYPAR